MRDGLRLGFMRHRDSDDDNDTAHNRQTCDDAR